MRSPSWFPALNRHSCISRKGPRMQQQFTGKWGDRAGGLLLAVFGVALPVGWLLGVMPEAPHSGLTWPLFGFILVASLSLVSFATAGIIESCAVFIVDDDGITKRSVLGAVSIPWDRVVRLSMSDQRKSNIVLTDDSGRRLCIRQSLGSEPEALAQIVTERLAALTAKQLAEFGTEVRVFRPNGAAAWACLVMPIPFTGMGLALLRDPNMFSGPTSGRLTFAGLLLAFGLAGFGLFLHLVTQRLTVSPGEFSDASLFRTRRIRFGRIDSVMSRELATKAGGIEMTTVCGDGQSISFTASMPDYALLRDYLRAHAGQEAREQGEQAVPVAQRRESRQMIVAAVLLNVLMFGLGAWVLARSAVSLERQHELDVHGVTTTGVATGGEETGGKSSAYYVDFTFNVNGLHHRGRSMISRRDFEKGQSGDAIGITYLPGDPSVCRSVNSIARERAEDQRRSPLFLFGLLVLYDGLIAYAIRRRARKLAAA